MESVKKEILIGGALVLAAAGAYAYLSTPRGGSSEEKTDKKVGAERIDTPAAAAPLAPAAPAHKERSFIMVKPDGV